MNHHESFWLALTNTNQKHTDSTEMYVCAYALNVQHYTPVCYCTSAQQVVASNGKAHSTQLSQVTHSLLMGFPLLSHCWAPSASLDSPLPTGTPPAHKVQKEGSTLQGCHSLSHQNQSCLLKGLWTRMAGG